MCASTRAQVHALPLTTPIGGAASPHRRSVIAESLPDPRKRGLGSEEVARPRATVVHVVVSPAPAPRKRGRRSDNDALWRWLLHSKAILLGEMSG
jgi:hypothetical protein